MDMISPNRASLLAGFRHTPGAEVHLECTCGAKPWQTHHDDCPYSKPYPFKDSKPWVPPQYVRSQVFTRYNGDGTYRVVANGETLAGGMDKQELEQWLKDNTYDA